MNYVFTNLICILNLKFDIHWLPVCVHTRTSVWQISMFGICNRKQGITSLSRCKQIYKKCKGHSTSMDVCTLTHCMYKMTKYGISSSY